MSTYTFEEAKKQLDIINPKYNYKSHYYNEVMDWDSYNTYRLLSNTFSKLVSYTNNVRNVEEYKFDIDHIYLDDDFRLFMDLLKHKNSDMYNGYITYIQENYVNNSEIDYTEYNIRDEDEYGYREYNDYDDFHQNSHRMYDDDEYSGLYPTPDGMGTDDWDDYLEANNID